MLNINQPDPASATAEGDGVSVFSPINPKGVAEAAPAEIVMDDDDLICDDCNDADIDLADLTDEEAYEEQVAATAVVKRSVYPSKQYNAVWSRSLHQVPRSERSSLEHSYLIACKNLIRARRHLSKAANGGELITRSRRVMTWILASQHYGKLVKADNERRRRPYRPSIRTPYFFITKGMLAIVDDD